MPESSFKLGHLLEALSIAQRWQTEDPPNPSTRAALQHGIGLLLADLKALAPDSLETDCPEQPLVDASRQHSR